MAEFTERHNVREFDTIEQMGGVVAGMAGKRLTYQALVSAKGFPSGARARTTTRYQVCKECFWSAALLDSF